MSWLTKTLNKATGGTWNPYIESDDLEAYRGEHGASKKDALKDLKYNERQQLNAKDGLSWGQKSENWINKDKPDWTPWKITKDGTLTGGHLKGRNEGGPIPDLNDPTNVDSVPAMLTPGEFVLNKEASQMFAPHLEAMNNAGLQQRQAENFNMGGPMLAGPATGYGYNVGGLVTFLKDKEGWKDTAYQDDAGVWTIGYGRTGGIKKGDTTTRKAEDSWLDNRAQEEWDAISDFGKKHGYEWSDGQHQALASFRYNGGQGMIDMLTKDGTRDNAAIQSSFGKYNKVTDPDTGEKVFIQGLQNRRDAELELWGGQGNQVPGDQSTVPTTEAPPVPAPEEVPAETGGDFPSGAASQLATAAFTPPPPIQAPALQGKGPAPEYIPSVASQSPAQPVFQEDEFGVETAQSAFGTFNRGGQVQYLRRGGAAGKKKVWDSEKGTYIWVDPSDPRVARDAEIASKAPPKQTAPMNFKKAAEIRAEQAIQQPLAPPPEIQAPTFAGGVKDKDPYDINNIGLHFGNQINMQDNNTGPIIPPQFNTSPPPPPPGSDEDILQNSSDQSSDNEAERQRQNALLGDYAKQFPKGDPRRRDAFNQQQHQKGAVHPGVQAELPPQIPGAAPPVVAGRPNVPVGSLPGAPPVPQIEMAPPMNFPNNLQPGAQNLRHGAQWDTPQAQPMAVPNQAPAGGAVDQSAAIAEGERLRQNALLGDQAKQFPEGDPRRAALFNQQAHQKGGVPGGPAAELPPTPPDPQAPSSVGPGNVPQPLGEVSDLSGLTEEQIGSLYDVGNTAAERYAQSEDDIWQATQQLDLVNKAGAVMSPETVGGTVNQAQQATLEEELAGLQSTPEGVLQSQIGEQPTLAPSPVTPNLPGAWARPEIPEELGTDFGGTNLQQDIELTPNLEQDPRGKDQRNLPPTEQKAVVKDAIANTGEEVPNVTPEEMTDIKTAGQQQADASPAKANLAGMAVKEAFGDLFDSKELARMGILMLGAMATGMSPGRALAFAGSQYINRIDSKAASKQANKQALLKSGKYSPQSVDAYSESGDASQLIPVGTPMKQSGKFKDFYGPGGKKVRAQEVDIGGNKLWVDGSGKPIDGFKFNEDASSAPGTKEYETRVRASQGDITKQVKSLREQLDVFEIGPGEKGSKTDINPESQGPEIAKWAIDNGVDPAEVGTLVESAYHDMLNDSRQDGSRARSIVPYLNQLTIRNQVGANADAFLSKGYSGKGPKQYVSGKKLAVLNKSVSNMLRQMGKKGGSQDLANLFYNAALSDWNALDADDKKQYERQALNDESGFYVFAQKQMLNKLGG